MLRNESKPDSDIDILVELDYSKHIGLKFIRMKNELEVLLNNRVDLISENSLSEYIKPIIDRDKMLIYKKS